MFGPYEPRHTRPSLEADMLPSVYRAIQALRRAGHSVYRRDTSHSVDGRTIDTLTLLKMARACQRSSSST